MIFRSGLIAVFAVGTSLPAAAQESAAPSRSVGADVAFSTDADRTSVVRFGLNGDWDFKSVENYTGLRVERTTYRPLGDERTSDHRAYLRIARPIDGWRASATIGSDGKNVFGSATLHNQSRFRQEYFIERDKVETRTGVRRPIVYTFGGAAIDLPLSRVTQLTVLGGLQSFTGRNERIHVRGNLIQTLDSERGISGQLRTRYFRNSVANELDYFSPKEFLEILPVLQVRRFRGGWQYVAAGGLGAQKASGGDWRQSRFANLRVSSPANRLGWAVNGDATFSNQPISNEADSYSYLRTSIGLARRF